MTTSPFEPPIGRVYAELPSGEHLVPGAHPLCPGPDHEGMCPMDDVPSGRPCAGATWQYRTTEKEGWSIKLASEPSTCPAMLFDPLGPSDVPLD
jgi:hypothetical protein